MEHLEAKKLDFSLQELVENKTEMGEGQILDLPSSAIHKLSLK